jgi:cell division protein FtsI (penicillin-binding protein 3)
MGHDKKDIIWRIRLIYFAMVCFAFLIIYKIIVIQFVEGDFWRKKAENLSLRYESVEAVRGSIYSSDSSLLATSIPIFDVKIDLHKTVIPTDTFTRYLNSLSDSLSRIFPEKTRDEYKKYLLLGRKKGKRDLLIRKNIDYTQLKRLRTFPLLKKGRYKGGFIVEEKDYRKMPFQILAQRTIGYKNIEENLYVGLEGAYSKELEGVSGKRLMRKIANGIWRPVESNNQIEPENGKDIISTININIQDVAESALMKCLDSNDADHGCAILMEVKTGYIKAIANLKRRSDGSYREDINYAIWESAEPGSTFKLASLIAVLEEGKFDTNTIVNTGVTFYAGKKMEDSHPEGYGKVTVTKAFEVSSNVGISEIVTRTFQKNPQKFIDYLKDMSLDKPLNIELKGESNPYIKDTKSTSWSKTSLPWMSIGYELLLTPLQTLTLYNAVANNGTMVKPLFVKEILQTGKLIEKKEPVVIKNSICSERTLKKVQSILEGVIEHGTAKHLLNTVYKIAGKTGTAKIGYAENKESKIYRASFVGYFPADNPKYSCIVVINNPKKGVYYGGAIAAPVFKEIADRVFATQLDINQNYKPSTANFKIPYVNYSLYNDLNEIYSYLQIPFNCDSQGYEYVVCTKKDSTVLYKNFDFNTKTVPNFYGMGSRDAVYIAEKLGLKPKIIGKGKVIGQSIPASSPVLKGSTIVFNLNRKDVEIQGNETLNFKIGIENKTDSSESVNKNNVKKITNVKNKEDKEIKQTGSNKNKAEEVKKDIEAKKKKVNKTEESKKSTVKEKKEKSKKQ